MDTIKAVLRASLALALVPAWASNPGDPLDCTDLQPDSPGYSCSIYAPMTPSGPQYYDFGQYTETDNEGQLLEVRRHEIGPCFSFGSQWRTQIIRINGTTETVVAHWDDRCFTSYMDRIEPANVRIDSSGGQTGILNFDRSNGRVLAHLASVCQGGGCSYGTRHWVASIAGFTTLFEVLQTYDPVTNQLAFRVPYMPEGMGGVDYFDTYYGSLSTPIDFTQAQALQCQYPGATPNVGDFLTVADTLPNPSAGHGYYFVTAATYQGQKRYGRQGTTGQLTGRDPQLLPACLK